MIVLAIVINKKGKGETKMKNIKFSPIEEKMQDIVVEGQVAPGCLCDCTHYSWKSNHNSKTKGCYQKVYYDAQDSSRS